MMMLPKPKGHRAAQPSLSEAVARYRMVLGNPRSFVCFAIVFLEGLAIYGIMPLSGSTCARAGPAGCAKPGS
jgi:hypothetical protein